MRIRVFGVQRLQNSVHSKAPGKVNIRFNVTLAEDGCPESLLRKLEDPTYRPTEGEEDDASDEWVAQAHFGLVYYVDHLDKASGRKGYIALPQERRGRMVFVKLRWTRRMRYMVQDFLDQQPEVQQVARELAWLEES